MNPPERVFASRLSPLVSPRFTTLPPLSLYIHIPWCVRKCPYCDFNSHEARGTLPEQAYVAALIADLEHALPLVWGRGICSVFFGGGTPSLLSAGGIDAILSAVRARLPLSGEAEVTLEANPGTFEAEKFRAFRAAGVNRLSIGIQSFDARHLQALGRIHDDNEARRAIEIARHDFDNINLDLMYGLPAQSVGDALSDINTALSYSPAHLSAYHLTIEPNTYFHRHPPSVPDDDTASDMLDLIAERTASAGLERYEVSAFARRGHRCVHNLNYWQFGDYLGIGAGAHSKLTFPGKILRQMRFRQPNQYMESAAGAGVVQQEHEVGVHEVGFEFMMNTLRLRTGFAPALFEARAGLPLTAVLRELEEAERRGLIARDYARIAPTALGRRFLNDLLQLFLPAAAVRGGPKAAG